MIQGTFRDLADGIEFFDRPACLPVFAEILAVENKAGGVRIFASKGLTLLWGIPIIYRAQLLKAGALEPMQIHLEII